MCRAFVVCIVVALIAVSLFAQSNHGLAISKAQVLGPEDLSREITVNVWLKS